MSKAFGITFAVVAVAIAALVWIGFANTKGNHLAPTGSIGKVRTIQASDDVTFMVIDFTVRNDSDRDMIVHSVESLIDEPGGGTIPGGVVANADIKSAFQNYPLLGDQYNPVLKERDTIPAHQKLDRMVGIRFDVPLKKVESRKQVVLRVEDITGPVLELKK
jgi:hypothetical protein